MLCPREATAQSVAMINNKSVNSSARTEVAKRKYFAEIRTR